MTNIRTELEDIIQQALTSESLNKAKNKIRDIIGDLVSEFEYQVQTDCAYNLSRYVQRMAEASIEAMLKGDNEEMRKRLHCVEGGYTGRDRQHSVIHGKLFETGAIELRKQIVNAHAELLKSERILDLEDQVKSLVDQVRRLEARNDELARNWRTE